MLNEMTKMRQQIPLLGGTPSQKVLLLNHSKMNPRSILLQRFSMGLRMESP